MAIQITNAKSYPALVYNKVHLKELKILQPCREAEVPVPNYDLFITYVTYAVDEEGNRYYQSDLKSITIKDYAALALEKAQAGDTDLFVAMQAIEAALASIIEDQTDLGTAEVV